MRLSGLKYLVFILLYTNLVAQTTIAVIDFDARGISPDEVATLTDRFRDELTKTNQYTVIERGKMEEVLREQGFQQSGCASDECVVEVGQLIGVQQMVGGSIGKVGDVYSVSARIIDVQTGKIINVMTYDHIGSIGDLLTTGMLQIVSKLVGEATTSVVTKQLGLGSLYITSVPSGANVWVDGVQQTGITPIMLDNLAAGEHEVLGRKGDFSNSQKIEVSKDDILKLDLTLKLGKGKLKVVSNPFEATVTVDGIVKGKTPLVIRELTAGIHNLVVSLSGYNKHSQKVIIKSNHLVNLDVTLEEYVFQYGSVTDIDGNTYKTIKIGDQWWMAENLKVSHYRNGDAIPTGHSNSEWADLSTGAYVVYDDNERNSEPYGYLYNWYAVDDNRNIAPAGWHIPTDDEWKELEIYLGMSQSAANKFGWRDTDEGGKLKETGTAHWNSPNTGATNESGFTALPGGYRGSYDGGYYDLGNSGSFWSSTEDNSHNAWSRRRSYYYSGVYRGNSNKESGFSVRCVRDY